MAETKLSLLTGRVAQLKAPLMTAATIREAIILKPIARNPVFCWGQGEDDHKRRQMQVRCKE